MSSVSELTCPEPPAPEPDSSPRGTTSVERVARDHGAELLSFLKRRTTSAQDAADLRQDVLVRLLSVPAQESISNARAYLFQVARRLLIDRRRRKQVEATIFEEGVDAAEKVCPTSSPESAAANAVAVQRLQEAVADLPEKIRMALLWNRLDGLSLKEVGARLGVSESMACRYVNEALSHCYRKLHGRGGKS
ncbi:RNA polymerase sigma factor [Steroidobacter flavus]|uniref:RNA polymerase sigma factor n=1 Tax=Steroidobacter flavus TaxID=1842136 RepID=A0ABV8T4A2_9GAMM